MKRNKLQHIKSSKKGFKAPKEYFDTVEDAVFTKLTAQNFSKKEGFTMPTSYFETVENSVFNKIQKEKDCQKAGFKIPKNYLDTLEDKVLTKIDNHKKEIKVIDFKSVILKRIVPFVAAASLVLFIVINYNSNTISFENIASTEIEKWIENDLIILDAYEIAEVYQDTEIENQDIFAEDELVEYLNGTDIESLLLEN